MKKFLRDEVNQGLGVYLIIVLLIIMASITCTENGHKKEPVSVTKDSVQYNTFQVDSLTEMPVK